MKYGDNSIKNDSSIFRFLYREDVESAVYVYFYIILYFFCFVFVGVKYITEYMRYSNSDSSEIRDLRNLELGI